MVLNAGALKHLRPLLKSPRNNIVKEAAWTISNITAGNANQIQRVIDAGLFEDICEVLQGGEFRSQKEAAWVVTNVTSSGNEEQILYLIENVGILKPFCDLMTSKDARCVLVILSGLKNLLVLADKRGFTDKFITVRIKSQRNALFFFLVFLRNQMVFIGFSSTDYRRNRCIGFVGGIARA